MRSGTILAFVIGLFVANAAIACSFSVPPEGYVPSPISSKNDCSFNRDGLYWPTNGQAAQNLGNARISQLIGLNRGTAVIVSDCNTAETITIFGKDDGEEDSCGQPFEIESHIKPSGRFDLTKGGDLVRVASRAKRAGFKVSLGASHLNISEPSNRQINAFCGCGLYYPDSNAGRTQ